MNLIELAENGFIPDWLIRAGIRRLLAGRIRHERRGDVEEGQAAKNRFLESLREGPIAVATREANLQHYEVPTEFFEMVLGPRLKYSACYFSTAATTLAEAEETMLALFCERAELSDGMEILELGCGWGAVGLWIAEKYPNSPVVAVSNSKTQREKIERSAREKGLTNLEVITSNIADFTTSRRFERIISVEMFEHVRNHERLMANIAEWLRDGGKLAVHIFCHRELAYPFETEGAANWMGRHFFTGGIMPSDDMLLHFQRDMLLEARWRVCGLHYTRTLEAWLANCDRHRDALRALFVRDLGARGSRPVSKVAHVLHGLRGTLQVPARAGVVRFALPVRQALSDLSGAGPSRSGIRLAATTGSPGASAFFASRRSGRYPESRQDRRTGRCCTAPFPVE